MKKIMVVVILFLGLMISSFADARGGFSSGGGGRSFSSGSSFSRGSFSSSRPSYSSSSYSRPSYTTTRSTSYRSSSFVQPYHPYGGLGMGYSYHNGFLTGLIIGNMMHPYGSMMYTGPGVYANNALLYPNGMVVNQQGYQVGMYQNGQYQNVSNGQYVAQAVPQDAQQQPQPVVIQNDNDNDDIMVIFIFGCVLLFVILPCILITI